MRMYNEIYRGVRLDKRSLEVLGGPVAIGTAELRPTIRHSDCEEGKDYLLFYSPPKWNLQ